MEELGEETMEEEEEEAAAAAAAEGVVAADADDVACGVLVVGDPIGEDSWLELTETLIA